MFSYPPYSKVLKRPVASSIRSKKKCVVLDERIESANSNGAVTLGNKTLQPEWSSRSVSFNYSQLDYGTAYTFTMPAGYVQDKSGNKYAEAVVISFTTM